MALRQSVVLPMFSSAETPLEELFGRLRAIGYEGVEIWSRGADFEELVETAHSCDLRMVSMVAHGHESPDGGAHAEGFSRAANHDRLEAEVTESVDLACRHGIPGIIVLSGHRNPGESDYEALGVCAAGLKRVAPYAEKKGVNLNMEVLNSKIDHPHYLCDRLDWAVSLCELVASPRVKILFDIYHVQIMEGDIVRKVQRAAKWIGHYHTAGNPGRNDLDDRQELNYRGICRAIAATGYDLYIGHEFRPKGDPVEALRAAYETCRME